MGLGDRILGFVSAPFVGARQERTELANNVVGARDNIEDDRLTEFNFGPARPQTMVPITMIQQPGGLISERAYGTHNLIPGRALSAQVRLKNNTWELPAYGWTLNPDGAPYILRAPGLPGMTVNMQYLSAHGTQPEFLQPVTNLEIANDISWLAQFRQKIFGSAAQQSAQQNAQTMFPSVFGPSVTE